MTDHLRVACVQMTSGPAKHVNLERAEKLIEDAASKGADLIVLPEHWNVLGEHDLLRETAEDLEEGESVACLRAWSKRLGVGIVGGSIIERRRDHNKVANSCVVVDREGTLRAVYRKIHLFDVCVGGVEYRESDLSEHGAQRSMAQVESWLVGLTICYDLRFPELYRQLALEGAELITVPANFTMFTGKDHWEVLLRARAIENQLFVAAAAQFGESRKGRPSYGRSLICDPWGTVLVQAADKESTVLASVDRACLRSIRNSLPSLANRVPAAYSPTLLESKH